MKKNILFSIIPFLIFVCLLLIFPLSRLNAAEGPSSLPFCPFDVQSEFSELSIDLTQHTAPHYRINGSIILTNNTQKALHILSMEVGQKVKIALWGPKGKIETTRVMKNREDQQKARNETVIAEKESKRFEESIFIRATRDLLPETQYILKISFNASIQGDDSQSKPLACMAEAVLVAY